MKTYFAALARFSRFLAERGMPRTQRAIRREHVDLDESVAIVLGTGRRPRACPFGNKTAQALDRYLRLRLAHPHAKRTELWLSPQGRPHRQRRVAGAAAPRPRTTRRA